MTNGKAEQGRQKPVAAVCSKKDAAKITKKDRKNQRDITISDSDISIDFSGENKHEADPNFIKEAPSNAKSIQELQQDFNQQIALVKAQFKGQIEMLENILKSKDEVIGKLQTEVGELRQTCNFLTHETKELNGKIKLNEVTIQNNVKKTAQVADKTVDLEDRSRRSNLVFFNIREKNDDGSGPEDCEGIIINLLESKNFFHQDYRIHVDRAHRLGKKRSEPSARPRPIIVKFTYYRDKQDIIKNAHKLKGTQVGVSEDYSKATLDVHKSLVQHAKDAKENKYSDAVKAIVNFKVTYRRVLITYTTCKTDPHAKKFTRSFSLDDIQGNSRWYIPHDTRH